MWNISNRLAAIVDVSNLPAAIGGVLDEDQLQYDEWKDKLLGGSDVWYCGLLECWVIFVRIYVYQFQNMRI